MRAPYFLAFSVWPAAFGASFYGLVTFEQAPVLTGEIIFERISTCEYVSVKTDQGYSLLDVDGGLVEIAGGSRIIGRLTAPGVQSIRVDNRATLAARVQGFDCDLLQAKARFDRVCGAEPSPNVHQMVLGGT